MMKYFSFVISFVFLIFFSQNSFAQSIEYKGKLLDAQSNLPIIGANIKCGNSGTITDSDGKFELQIDRNSTSIVISYIGYVEKIIDTKSLPINTTILLEPKDYLLQTTTVTAGKYEKPIGEVTVSLEVIKPRLIENINSTSVDEVLDKVPGVHIIDGQANIRGGSGFSYGAGSRVMLLIDDIPALQADAGFPNWDDIPVESVDQIDVLKGASSTLYGSSALNGIVNVRSAFAKSEPITKISTFTTLYMNPRDTSLAWWNKNKGDLDPITYGVSAFHAQKFGKLDFTAGGYYLYRNETNEKTYTRYGRFTSRLQYRFSDRLSAAMNVNFNKGISNYFFFWKDGGSGRMQGFPLTYTSSDKIRFYIDPTVTYFDKYENKHKFLGRFYSVNNQVSGDKSNKSNLYYAEYQFQRVFARQYIATAGLVYTGTSVKAQLYGDSLLSSSNYAAYAQLEKKFFDRLNVNVGLRYESNQINSPVYFAGDTIPNGKSIQSKPVFRFGMNLQAAKATYIRASFGQGYRFPTIAEKYIKTNVGFSILPNTKLTSETGWTTELAVKQGFRIGNFEGFLDLAGFWQEYQNMMEFTFVPEKLGFQSQNIGNTVIKGVEFSVLGRGKIGNFPVNLMAGYMYIDPKYQNFTAKEDLSSSVNYNILKYRFKHSIKMDADVTYKSFSIGGTLIYNSNMEAVDNVFEILIPGAKQYRADHNKGFTVLDIRLNYKLNENVKVALITKNITNKEYSFRPGLLEAPRNITVRMDASF
ncbi:MAG: TonB-dependent receptor [Saprospiraceae bacterium]|nr:TonB-dependent receptor [Saprospiraceae bacterium]